MTRACPYPAAGATGAFCPQCIDLACVSYTASAADLAQATSYIELERWAIELGLRHAPGECDSDFRERTAAAWRLQPRGPMPERGHRIGATSAMLAADIMEAARVLREDCGVTGGFLVMCGSEETAERMRAGVGGTPGVAVVGPSGGPTDHPLLLDEPDAFPGPEPPQETFTEWHARTGRRLDRLPTEATHADHDCGLGVPESPQDSDDGARDLSEPRSLHELVGQVLDWGGETGIEE
ncbi:MAG: hypothetical protein V3W41_14645 [Planctomycetota bacterium]